MKEIQAGMPRPEDDCYRILVLDDNVQQMETIKIACQMLGQEVVPVTSIKEGMNYLNVKDHVDVLVAEVFLENESVFDLLKLLKGKPDHADVPVMLISVHPGHIAQFFNEQMQEAAAFLGAHKFLVMPEFDVESLMKEIAAVLPERKIPKKLKD